MALYNFDAQKIQPEELAQLLDLKFDQRTLPYPEFFRAGKPVGYVVREGVVSFLDEVRIPAELLLKLC